MAEEGRRLFLQALGEAAPAQVDLFQSNVRASRAHLAASCDGATCRHHLWGTKVEATYKGTTYPALIVAENADGETLHLMWLNPDGTANGTRSKHHPKANVVNWMTDRHGNFTKRPTASEASEVLWSEARGQWNNHTEQNDPGDVDRARDALKNGADINCQSDSYFKCNTPLFMAAYQGHPEMVRFLLENGADKDIEGETEGGPAGKPIDIARHKLEKASSPPPRRESRRARKWRIATDRTAQWTAIVALLS